MKMNQQANQNGKWTVPAIPVYVHAANCSGLLNNSDWNVDKEFFEWKQQKKKLELTLILL